MRFGSGVTINYGSAVGGVWRGSDGTSVSHPGLHHRPQRYVSTTIHSSRPCPDSLVATSQVGRVSINNRGQWVILRRSSVIGAGSS